MTNSFVQFAQKFWENKGNFYATFFEKKFDNDKNLWQNRRAAQACAPAICQQAKYTKISRKPTKNSADLRIFLLFLAMFGQFDGKIITKCSKIEGNFVILHKICADSRIF